MWPLRKVFAQGAVALELGGRLCIDNLSVRLTRSEVTSIWSAERRTGVCSSFEPPEGSDWTYEVKLDGYRAIAVKPPECNEVGLVSGRRLSCPTVVTGRIGRRTGAG